MEAAKEVAISVQKRHGTASMSCDLEAFPRGQGTAVVANQRLPNLLESTPLPTSPKILPVASCFGGGEGCFDSVNV